MNIYIKDIKEENCVCDALILPFTEGDSKLYDNRLNSSVSKTIKRSFSREFHGKHNEVLLLPCPENIKPERILLLGLGKKDEISHERVRQAGGKASVYLRDSGMKKIALSTNVLLSLNLSPTDFIEGTILGLYKFKKYVKEQDEKKIEKIVVLSRSSKKLKEEINWTEKVASSVCFARDLINTPANDMTPTHLAKVALSLKQRNLPVKILERRDAEKLGMDSYLSVVKGSKESPKFVVLDYKGAEGKPLVIIGKSITFDSGGISLKPADGMGKMKYDMAGGAVVLGIIRAISELKLPAHVIGILPATENLIGDAAARPGDVVRAMNGKTIEIINTDAEGRMTLADAIVYAKRFKPKAIIDIATLTGACAIAFGNGAIAMTGNNKELSDKIKKAGENVYERVWEMPLFEEYKEYLKSDVADLKNTGGREGSLLSSAYFLYEFAEQVPWVHLDIAGTAWVEKEKPYIPKGATGIGLRLMLDYIRKLI
jgi:leucyl aminopeptidase